MASFFKELFEKRKDMKYGKGYKLGDSTPRPETAQAANPTANRPQPSNPTEAARRAGEAALQRIEESNSKLAFNSLIIKIKFIKLKQKIDQRRVVRASPKKPNNL